MRSKREVIADMERVGLRAIVDGKMQCRECQVWYPVTKFYVHFNRKRNINFYDRHCHDCRLLYMRMRRLLITPAQYDALLKRSGGLCELCGSDLDKPNVDHCHTTGKLRGVLCATCNTAIGMFHDSADELRRAARYIEQWADVPMTAEEKREGLLREKQMSAMRERLTAIKRKARASKAPATQDARHEQEGARNAEIAVTERLRSGATVTIVDRRRRRRA